MCTHMHTFLGITPLVIGYISSRLNISYYHYYYYYCYYYNFYFVQGVGGAVHLPKGFLKAAYELIRERGGVCIADEVLHVSCAFVQILNDLSVLEKANIILFCYREVQTGFGRLGTHYWGFETEGVIPDIGM